MQRLLYVTLPVVVARPVAPAVSEAAAVAQNDLEDDVLPGGGRPAGLWLGSVAHHV